MSCGERVHKASVLLICSVSPSLFSMLIGIEIWSEYFCIRLRIFASSRYSLASFFKNIRITVPTGISSDDLSIL